MGSRQGEKGRIVLAQKIQMVSQDAAWAESPPCLMKPNFISKAVPRFEPTPGAETSKGVFACKCKYQ